MPTPVFLSVSPTGIPSVSFIAATGLARIFVSPVVFPVPSIVTPVCVKK
jgi:hypothetical protein